MRITRVDQRESSVGHSWRWLPKLPLAQIEIKKKLGRDRQMYAFNRFLQEVYPKYEWGHSLCWVTVRSWLPIPQRAAGPHCSLTGMENSGQMFKWLLFFEWQAADFLVDLQQWWVLVLQHRPSLGLRDNRSEDKLWQESVLTLLAVRSMRQNSRRVLGLCLLYLLLLSRL